MHGWEVESDGVGPHPVWWDMQMGHWPDVTGPFERILDELAALNDMWTECWGRPLFRTTDRPRTWGWLLRASTTEWDDFMLTTDKLLSDNIDPKALDACGAPTTDADDNRLGTLRRLEAFLLANGTWSEDAVQDLLRPLHDVRKQRQGPAHGLREAVTDPTLLQRQRELLHDVVDSLDGLRHVVGRHPTLRRRGWSAPAHLDRADLCF